MKAFGHPASKAALSTDWNLLRSVIMPGLCANLLRADYAAMTKDKFQMLCEQVLVPRMGDMMNSQLATVHETLDIIAAAIARIERKLDKRS